MVSPGFEVHDPQDHGEGEERFCSGDGTQDASLGAAFGEPLASEGEAGSAEQRMENSDHSRENALLLFELCDGGEQLLAVLSHQLDGNDRSRTTPSPRRNGGARDGDVLGQASGAGTDHMIPETVVVGVAGPRRGREGVHRHEDSTARDSTTSEKPNDTKAVEVAYTKVRNVPAHSWVMEVAWCEARPRTNCADPQALPAIASRLSAMSCAARGRERPRIAAPIAVRRPRSRASSVSAAARSFALALR